MYRIHLRVYKYIVCCLYTNKLYTLTHISYLHNIYISKYTYTSIKILRRKMYRIRIQSCTTIFNIHTNTAYINILDYSLFNTMKIKLLLCI